MVSPITDLISALRSEVDRVVAKRTISIEDRDLLSEILIDSIYRTLKEIKMGSDADEFQDLVMINFVISADDRGVAADLIHDFVKELKKDGE